MSNERDENGRFTPGNSGGPGRPRRTVEHDYLAVLGDTVSLEDWRKVVARAVADAKSGDARARDWVTKYLIGNDPPQLVELAARERRGTTVDELVDNLAGKQQSDAEWATRTQRIMDDLMTR